MFISFICILCYCMFSGCVYIWMYMLLSIYLHSLYYIFDVICYIIMVYYTLYIKYDIYICVIYIYYKCILYVGRPAAAQSKGAGASWGTGADWAATAGRSNNRRAKGAVQCRGLQCLICLPQQGPSVPTCNNWARSYGSCVYIYIFI